MVRHVKPEPVVGVPDVEPPHPDPDPDGNHTLWSDAELAAPGANPIEEAIKAKYRKREKG
jgi:hypothetical protein